MQARNGHWRSAPIESHTERYNALIRLVRIRLHYARRHGCKHAGAPALHLDLAAAAVRGGGDDAGAAVVAAAAVGADALG